MLLSETGKEELKALSVEKKTKLVYGDYADDGLKGDAVLLLGGNPDVIPDRSQAAAELFSVGRAPYIVPSGGVLWDTGRGRLSEAELMTLLLKEAGVPESAIIVENEARTTQENMIYGTLQLQRALNFRAVDRVIVVTSAFHLRRSVALAKLYLPRKVKISGYPGSCLEGSREHWFEDKTYSERVENELMLLKDLVDEGQIDDIEF